MSQDKKQADQWKAEQQRAERKARLSGMKSKEGGKKQIQAGRPVVRIVVLAVLILALAGTSVWALVRMGVPERKLTAARVGGVSVYPVDINYYYHLLLNSYQIDPDSDQGRQMLASPSGDPDHPTLDAFIKHTALQSVQKDIMLTEEARQAGYTLTADEEAAIDQYLSNLSMGAAQQGTLLDNYLTALFGTGMNESFLRQIAERVMLSERFRQDQRDALTYSDADLEAAYQENTAAYDVVQYRLFTFDTERLEEASDDEKEEAKEEARKKAESMRAQVTDQESFRQQCLIYVDEASRSDYEDQDASLYANRHQTAIANAAQRDWLFDEGRQANELAVLESGNSFHVIMFLDRSRADARLMNIRHILLSARRDQASDEELAVAEAKAQELLAAYQSGEQTEEAFALLAMLNSEDGNAAQGGLYEEVAPGQMVKEFNDWCFDASRKTGDTGVVQTDFGFHVMYYVSQGPVDWQVKVENDLRNQHIDSYLTGLQDAYPVQTQAFGYRFVG